MRQAESKSRLIRRGSLNSMGPLARFDLDESPGAMPVGLQLKMALKKNAGKVIDLFRSWDENGDGVITRPEFHRAMDLLGLRVPKQDIDDLFTSWQTDGDEELSMREITILLRAPSLAEAIRVALAKRGLIRITEHFLKWGRHNADGALTVTREDFDRGLATLLSGQVDMPQATHLFETLDRHLSGSIELNQLETAVGLVKAKPVAKKAELLEILNVHSLRGEVRRELWGSASNLYGPKGQLLEQPADESPDEVQVVPLSPYQIAGEKRPPPACVRSQPARRIDVLSTHRERSHPPARRWNRVVLPPAPPRLSPSRLAQLRAPRPFTVNGMSPRLTASYSAMTTSTSLPSLPRASPGGVRPATRA